MRKSLMFLILTLIVALSLILGTVSVFADDPYIKLECEEADELSDEENPYADAGNKKLKRESKNIGATFDGAWIAFTDVDFAGNGANKFAAFYSKRPDRCAEDAKIEIRLGSVDGKKVGEVDLPTVGSGWGDYSLAEADLTEVVNGKHDVYVVMKGSTDESYWYIANIDYIEFFEAEASGDPETTPPATGEGNKPTGDFSVVYLAVAAAAAAFGGLKLKKK